MHAKVRPAVISDVDAILTILSPYAGEGLILERSAAEIRHALSTFFVAEVSGSIAGTVSHHDYGKNLKEVRSLAVRKELARHGTGSLLVRHLISSLRTRVPATRIFVLTYAPVFFQKLGFLEVSKESLPEKIWKDCDYCKNRDDCGETALVYQGLQGEVEQ
jgi:amino-acid N-acetyltransferase